MAGGKTDKELNYCKRNSSAIYRTAKFVYNTVTENKDPVMVKNCCDFKKLEAACAEYCKTYTNP
ncbi:MAG: type III toxin-antitoxin system ToxN/AbiQ family toxin [Oscillospiraceae bacterium]|nr:type III toxin-antitoxin system ToxN/AbiQ family toxin [Oscillospiraceae bacterium]